MPTTYDEKVQHMSTIMRALDLEPKAFNYAVPTVEGTDANGVGLRCRYADGRTPKLEFSSLYPRARDNRDMATTAHDFKAAVSYDRPASGTAADIRRRVLDPTRAAAPAVLARVDSHNALLDRFDTSRAKLEELGMVRTYHNSRGGSEEFNRPGEYELKAELMTYVDKGWPSITLTMRKLTLWQVASLVEAYDRIIPATPEEDS